MRAYHRLTAGERYQVYALKKAGLTQCAIADQICVNKSTISREFKRIAWLVHGSHKFPAHVFWMRLGLGLKR